jgi:hypothetical protein
MPDGFDDGFEEHLLDMAIGAVTGIAFLLFALMAIANSVGIF